MITALMKAGRFKTLCFAFVLLTLTVFGDWYTGTRITLEILYLIPMMLSSVVIRRWEIVLLAIACAIFRMLFQTPVHLSQLFIAGSAYLGSGLFVSELARNRNLMADHWTKIQAEHSLREVAEERARILVEGSPAAILTVDADGTVVASNRAADRLFLLSSGKSMQGRPIAQYLPILAEALRAQADGENLRAATQSQGMRENGELFMAETWFSTYRAETLLSTERSSTKLAAIVVDASEAMRDREEQGLKELLNTNRIMAAALSHEVLNLSGALRHFCVHLSETRGLGDDKDLHRMLGLIDGLQSMATLNLHPATEVVGQDVDVRSILDNLRIVIEPHWREIEGEVRWDLPPVIPHVVGDPHGLFQVMLNLAHNSHRAVQGASERALRIQVVSEGPADPKVTIVFADSGSGIANTEGLFQPFQKGAHGQGLGLHISRAILRTFGGELRYESGEGGRFAIELQQTARRQASHSEDPR